jgi:hypothetical protein
MAKTWGLKEALMHFGAKSRNQRSIWSGRSDDGETVVLALWADHAHRENGLWVYDDREWFDDQPDPPGAAERLENLKWAQDRCGGLFRVVYVKGKDGGHSAVAECYPQPNLRMKITNLDPSTGRFRAVQASA